MDKQKKLRFNVVDVIFLLAVLAGVVFVGLRLGGLDIVRQITGGSAPEPYVITFIGEEIGDYVVDRVEIGDPVTDDEATLDLGKVVDIQTGPAISFASQEDGQLVTTTKEGYSSILLTCQVQASDTGNGVNVDGLIVGVGHSMVVRPGDSKMYLVVYDIRKLSDSPYANN